jgi:hypothetical protein
MSSIVVPLLICATNAPTVANVRDCRELSTGNIVAHRDFRC